MRADHGQSTVAATSRALGSPRTPQPRYHAKGFAEMRQRMSGLLMDSKKRSHNILPKGEQSVSEREALTARDKRATLRPHRQSGLTRVRGAGRAQGMVWALRNGLRGHARAVLATSLLHIHAHLHLADDRDEDGHHVSVSWRGIVRPAGSRPRLAETCRFSYIAHETRTGGRSRVRTVRYCLYDVQLECTGTWPPCAFRPRQPRSRATDTHRTTPIQHMIMHCNRALCGTIYHTYTRSTACASNVSVASLPVCAAACVRRQKSHWLFCRARMAHARRAAAELVNLGRT